MCGRRTRWQVECAGDGTQIACWFTKSRFGATTPLRLRDGGRMSKTLLARMLAVGVVACSPANAKPEAGSTTAKAVSTLPAQRTLVSGRQVEATIQDSISSRHNTAGEMLRATVSADVKDAYGRVVIP